MSVFLIFSFFFLVFGTDCEDNFCQFSDNEGVAIKEEVLMQAIYQFNNCSNFCLQVNKKKEEKITKINITSKVTFFFVNFFSFLTNFNRYHYIAELGTIFSTFRQGVLD